MSKIIKGQRKIILKDSHRIREADIVLSEVLCRFILVPFKARFHKRFLEKIIALKKEGTSEIITLWGCWAGKEVLENKRKHRLFQDYLYKIDKYH